MKPVTSWARTLTGPIADTAAYFFDYPGLTDEPKIPRPSSPEEYYNKQEYHHTPGQTDSDSAEGLA